MLNIFDFLKSDSSESRTVFNLKVKQVGTVCDFELSWDKGKILSAEINYPESLTTLYQEWHHAYMGYYRKLRGRVNQGVTGTIRRDWRAILVQQETQLLYEFHDWLRSKELFGIRTQIANTARKIAEKETYWVDIFLTCTPLDLARLPWETWEIGTDLGVPGKIRIARKPNNIIHENFRSIRRKPRILVIVGDDTGLNFQLEKEKIQSLDGKKALVKFVGWEGKDEDIEGLKKRIFQAIADKIGWDILCFLGHSNETVFTGGELSIAPGMAIFIKEISESLQQAKKQGLQFAIFNSCSGISI
ncbi:MAG: hypothetical protein F6K10_33455, partial [Moorea sp. SIO2B7]|nr:hypothetical protein [Moorena sp. SIO2B7]